MSEARDRQRVPLERGCFVMVCHAGIATDNSLHKDQWLEGNTVQFPASFLTWEICLLQTRLMVTFETLLNAFFSCNTKG